MRTRSQSPAYEHAVRATLRLWISARLNGTVRKRLVWSPTSPSSQVSELTAATVATRIGSLNSAPDRTSPAAIGWLSLGKLPPLCFKSQYNRLSRLGPLADTSTRPWQITHRCT